MSRTTKQPPLVEMQSPPARTARTSGYVGGAGSLIDDEPASPAKKLATGPSLRERLAEFASSGAGKMGLAAACLLLIAFGVWRLMSEAGNPPLDVPRVRIMNAETGEMGWYKTNPRKPPPMPAGFHPVEYCFHNACGPAGGTPVILNSYVRKAGDTKCPKCGELVVGHNPRPAGYEATMPADWK